MRPLIDFVNITNFTAGMIRQYYHSNQIVHTSEAGYTGREKFCCSARASGLYFFEKEKLPADYGECEPAQLAKTIKREKHIFPNSKQYIKICDALRESQQEYRAFVDEIIDTGNPDLMLLNMFAERFFHYVEFSNLFHAGDTAMRPAATWAIIPASIEVILDSYIVPRFLQQDAQIFNLIRKCPECNKYYMGSAQSIFCSDACRMRDYRKRKKK